MKDAIKFLNRKLIIHKCGFKNFIATAQFLVKIKIDKFSNDGFGLNLN